MIRRLFVLGTVLGSLLLLWTQTVRAQQCTGQYANDPTYAMLIPKDYAAQGNVAATLWIAIRDGGVGSHFVTTTPGTDGFLKWNTYNATRVDIYESINGGAVEPYLSNVAASGSYELTLFNIGWGYTFVIVASGNGQSTQDHVNWTVASGPNDIIIKQDGLDTNFYWQTTTTFGGSSMLTSCTECAGTGGGLPHCINATHTPYSTISLTNSSSGESQSLPWQQSGNVAHSNENVSGSASLAISVLPGDSGTISIENKITCIMDGIIFDQQLPKPKTSPSGGSNFPTITGELAFTKVALKVPTHCTPLLDSNGNVIGLHCDVAYYCSPRSSPPDYQPTGLKTYHYTNPALVPPFWMSMSPGTALVFGSGPSQTVVWYFPFPELDGVLTGVSGMDPLLLDILSPAWVSDSSMQDCTKWISGISPWYMPKW